MPEGVDTPVPRSWRIERPGYDRTLHRGENSELLGHAGPNVGYAMKLVHHESGSLVLGAHEHKHDVSAVIAEIAMRRASNVGRAPVVNDVRHAARLLGYDAPHNEEFVSWRTALVHDSGHNEHQRRLIVNSVPDELIDGDDISDEVIAGWHSTL